MSDAALLHSLPGNYALLCHMGLHPIRAGLGAVMWVWGRWGALRGPLPAVGRGFGAADPTGGVSPRDKQLREQWGWWGKIHPGSIRRVPRRWRCRPTQPQKGFGVGEGHNCGSLKVWLDHGLNPLQIPPPVLPLWRGARGRHRCKGTTEPTWVTLGDVGSWWQQWVWGGGDGAGGDLQ